MTGQEPQPTALGTTAPASGSSGRPSAHRAERERLVELFRGLVEPIGRSLPMSAEIVLHDLDLLPNSIVAVHGDVTGRRVGDPATDLLLERAVSGELDTMVGYRTQLPDGRSMRSTTMIIRDGAGQPVAALCINSDMSMWHSLGRIAATMTETYSDETAPPHLSPVDRADRTRNDEPLEVFARDVDELAAHLIHQAILEQGVAVDLMKKEHKLKVVRSLQGRGFFMLRDAVEMIASSLQVTRFTIYNYLNELDDAEKSTKRSSSRNGKRKA